mgnify:FL=1
MQTNKRNLALLIAFVWASVAAFADGIRITHGPYLQNITETEATIVWTTNRVSVGWVETAPDDGSNFYARERQRHFDSYIGIKSEDSIHSVKLVGLKPGTTYRYRIYSQEVLSHESIRVHYGDVAATDVFRHQPLRFTTADRTKADCSFVVLNDVHARKNFITPMLEGADWKKRDMVIYNGDMVSELNSQDDVFAAFMDESISLFAKEKPFYYVRGNHETRGVFAPQLKRYFCPREQSLYYAVRQGPVFFIMLDSGEDKPDSDIEYAGITDYDAYRTEQAEWVKAITESEDFKTAKFRICIAHIPPQSIEQDAWHGPVEVAQKFVPALNKAGIDLMICGHLHRHEYYAPDALHNFPVLVNSNEACAVGTVQGGQLKVEVRDINGKTTFSQTYNAR